MTYTALGILITTVCFMVYHFISTAPGTEAYFKNAKGEESGSIQMILFNRILGGILFLLPALYFVLFTDVSATQMGLGLTFNGKVYLVMAGLIVLQAVIINFSAKGKENLERYPQIRKSEWSGKLLFQSAAGWILYLFGYEIMFRGYLFFFCRNETDLVSAIAINVSLYALAHVPKGRSEAFGSLAMGIVFCLLSEYSGSFIPAFLLHIAMAILNEWFSLKYQPNMKLQ